MLRAGHAPLSGLAQDVPFPQARMTPATVSMDTHRRHSAGNGADSDHAARPGGCSLNASVPSEVGGATMLHSAIPQLL